VVMAHGTTGTMNFGVARHAQRLAAAEFAVLVFDYRHFGTSDGQPRQLICGGERRWAVTAARLCWCSGWCCSTRRLRSPAFLDSWLMT
jgi:hypothetical protein